MPNTISSLFRKWRYGDEVVVVSGLPRSGTSMLMRMLEAGGLAAMTDDVRAADDDNPKGYYELERVKNLEKDDDKAWVKEARGKVIKVISHLLRELPEENFYRIVFARRDLSEVIASQNIMLERRGEPNPVSDDRAMDIYKSHLIDISVFARFRPNVELLEVSYNSAMQDPAAFAARVNDFLGGKLDVEKMAAAVDPALYRNRHAEPRSPVHADQS